MLCAGVAESCGFSWPCAGASSKTIVNPGEELAPAMSCEPDFGVCSPILMILVGPNEMY